MDKIQKHGCMYKFLEVINSEEFIKSREFNIITEGGTQMYPATRQKFVDRDIFIERVQTDFERQKITIKQFFEEIIKYTDLDTYDMDEAASEDDDEGDEGEDVSEPDDEQELLSTSERQQCKMCKIAQRDTLLKPCLHVHFCFKCIEKLHKPARMRKSQRVNCPLSFCEEPIDTYVRVGY
jgi:Zinc finger, C3HC4 type (RING finger)